MKQTSIIFGVIFAVLLPGAVLAQYGIPDVDYEDHPISAVDAVTPLTSTQLFSGFRAGKSLSFDRDETLEPLRKVEKVKIAVAKPLFITKANPEAVVPIVKFKSNSDYSGNYNLETVSGDGSSQTRGGSLKQLEGSDQAISVMQGSYSYIGDDGKTYSVDWTADERGFKASGAHIL